MNIIIKGLSYVLFPHLIYTENDDLHEANSKHNLIHKKYSDEFIRKLSSVQKKKYTKLQKISKMTSLYHHCLMIDLINVKSMNARANMYDYEFESRLTYNIQDPYLYVVNSSFSTTECEEMIRQFENEQSNHYNGQTGGGYTPNIKRTTEINITHTPSWSKWNDLCFKKLNIALQQYAKHCMKKCHNDVLFNILFNKGGIISDTGYQLQKYQKEQQFYKWHQDGSIRPGVDQHRIVTYLWYLNDVDEGGETLFFHGKVKPKKGTLILFPACWNYNHKGETPISNDKYIITGWVYSNV